MNKKIIFRINDHHPNNKKKGGKTPENYIRNRTVLFIIAQMSFLIVARNVYKKNIKIGERKSV